MPQPVYLTTQAAQVTYTLVARYARMTIPAQAAAAAATAAAAVSVNQAVVTGRNPCLRGVCVTVHAQQVQALQLG
jgi:hypothetical protein